MRKMRRMVDMPEYRTSRDLGEAVQKKSALVTRMIGVKNKKSLASLEIDQVRADERPLIKFHEVYQPYVFAILKRDYGFKERKDEKGVTHVRNGKLDAGDIYDDVMARLLGGLLWNFDFGGANVGKGAFRSYLKLVIRSVYVDTVRPEIIPVLDAHGDPVYSDEPVKGKDGKPKLDRDGNPVYKPKMQTRFTFLREMAEMSEAKGLPALFAQEKSHSFIAKLVLDLSVVAYMHLVEQREKAAKKGDWALEAMKAVFEDGATPRAVMVRLLEKGTIRDEGTFYVAKNRFLEAWDNVRYELIETICYTTVGGQPVKIDRDKNGKVRVRIPRGKADDPRSQEVRRRLLVLEDEASDYVKAKQKEAAKLFGKPRFTKVAKAFVEAMLSLQEINDEKEAEKNARHYR